MHSSEETCHSNFVIHESLVRQKTVSPTVLSQSPSIDLTPGKTFLPTSPYWERHSMCDEDFLFLLYSFNYVCPVPLSV